MQTLTRQQASLEENIELLQITQEDSRKKNEELEAAAKEQQQRFTDRQAEHEKLLHELEQKRASTDAVLKDLLAKSSQLEIHLSDHKEVEARLAETRKQLEDAELRKSEAEKATTALQETLATKQLEHASLSEQTQAISKELEAPPSVTSCWWKPWPV
ncbi:hypothetical protein [Verrucomicrobium spinosum]|uniref:hypothetical protein n=1 Tax=Verrucomicrobium spinosum TaxID=2736 RepID=UPI0009467781|nr:hypothetical protein [Verrucomicrobium spinosum]